MILDTGTAPEKELKKRKWNVFVPGVCGRILASMSANLLLVSAVSPDRRGKLRAFVDARVPRRGVIALGSFVALGQVNCRSDLPRPPVKSLANPLLTGVAISAVLGHLAKPSRGVAEVGL